MIRTCELQRHPERYEVYKKLINSYAWQLLRAKKITQQPLCEDCLARGCTRAAEEVHHAIPVERGRTFAEMRTLAYSMDNLVSLCRACHRARHAPQPATKQIENAFTRRFFGE